MKFEISDLKPRLVLAKFANFAKNAKIVKIRKSRLAGTTTPDPRSKKAPPPRPNPLKTRRNLLPFVFFNKNTEGEQISPRIEVAGRQALDEL